MSLIPDKDDVSIPAQKLESYSTLIYGLPGTGKTSLANQWEDSLLVLFEKGTTGMKTNEINLIEKSEETGKMVWELFKEAKSEIMTGEHPYQTIVIDTITRAYEYAMTYVIETKLDGVHPSDTEFNSGYSKLNKELKREFNELLSIDLGVVLLSHVKRKNVKDIKGNERSRIVADTGGSFGRFIMGEMDIVIFYDKDENGDRILRVEGTKDFDSKSRLKFPDGDITAGDSAKEAYENFKKAFDKAIALKNEKEGVTEKMVKQHLQSKQKKKQRKQKLKSLKEDIKNTARDVGLNRMEHKKEMKSVIGENSLANVNDVSKAEKYLDYLEKEYEG